MVPSARAAVRYRNARDMSQTNKDAIRRSLDELNRSWIDRRFDRMSGSCDEHIVMKGPGMKELLRGRQAFIESYVQFMQRSTVTEYTESGHSIDCWGNTGVATYDWAMAYEQDGKTSRDVGQDMFVFRRSGSHWVAVLRLILY